MTSGRSPVAPPRFRGLVWTWFLGDFRDHLFRSALVLLVLGGEVQGVVDDPGRFALVAAYLLALPVLIFSGVAGQLADRYDKARLLRWIRRVDVVLSLGAGLALMQGEPALLLAALGCLGLQATLLGAVKYGLIPQLLAPSDLVRGNALVQAAGALAILLGTLSAALLLGAGRTAGLGVWEVSAQGVRLVAFGCVVAALAGYRAACAVPATPPADPDLAVDWNPVTSILQVARLTLRDRTVRLAILGLSWFWFFGPSVMMLLADGAWRTLRADPGQAAVLLGLLCLGLGAGALLCDAFSFQRLEPGLVPFGSLGMTLCAADLFFLWSAWPPGSHVLPGSGDLLGSPVGVRLLLDLFLLAVCCGFFVVPLQALVQQVTPAKHRSRVLAGNGLLNLLFVALSAFCLTVVRALGMEPHQVFGALAVLNGVVAFYIYSLIPEFFLRLVAWFLAHVGYRLKVQGLERIPPEGPLILACNHVSFVDWLVIAATVNRPIRFVMWHAYAGIPLVRFLLRDARVIPIGSSRQQPELVEKALREVQEALERGEVVCIFPEGRVTSDGEVGPFRPGVERMARASGVPVLPMALRGFWGSLFSRRPRRLRQRWKRPWRRRVELVVGSVVPSEEVTAEDLRAAVAELRGEWR